MCSPIQKKALQLYLKNLGDKRNALTPMLNSINKAIDECNSWMMETNGSKKSFGEMMQQLEEIDNSALQICSTILTISKSGDDDDKTENSSSDSATAGPDAFHTTSSTDKYVTLNQLQSLMQMFETTCTKTYSLEEKYIQLEENFKMLNEEQKSLQIQQKSQTKKSNSHERRIGEVKENVKALNDTMKGHTWSTTTPFGKTTEITASVKETNLLVNMNNKKIQEIEKNIKTLFKKVYNSDASINEMSEKHLKLTSNLETFDQKNTKLEWKLGAMCQMLAKRYHMLDSVKDVLSKISLSRDEAYSQVIKDNNI
ncbi:uncharacterized protein LOC131948843 [Physella acuta]|uniref:uncharacterized protein LOC131948843 n=1 Tax=Physella acuta TaxID=109671 RepID=UPI0027DCAF97|nr:uncharacterized protein LOC131948843 [Physella acuta]